MMVPDKQTASETENDDAEVSGEREADAPKFRRRADARPDEVLDAALDVFTAKGFAPARVDEIAKKAGISKGAVYLYFPSKRSLLEGLVRRAVAPITKQALKITATVKGSALETIFMLLRQIVKHLRKPKTVAIPKIVLHEALAAPEIAEFYKNAVLDVAMPALRGLIEEGIRRGEIRSVDPDLTVRSIVGPVIAHVLMFEIFNVKPEGGLRLDELIENHILILEKGLSATERDQ